MDLYLLDKSGGIIAEKEGVRYDKRMGNPLTKTRQGELYALAQASLYSFFPIFALLVYRSMTPLYCAALSTLIGALFFAIILTIQKKWHEFKIKSAHIDILVATLLIGVAYYALVFIGIKKTTADNASIMLLMEIFFSLFILRLWKKEFLTKSHITGAILMSIGAFLILFQGGIRINAGNVIILGATALPPIGNYFAQKARQQVSSTMIMFIRSLISGVFLLFLARFIDPAPTAAQFSQSLVYIASIGFLFMGLTKIFWIEAIHRLPITKTVAFESLCPLFTMIFAYFILHEIPAAWQLFGIIPIFAGIWLLTTCPKKGVPAK